MLMTIYESSECMQQWLAIVSRHHNKPCYLLEKSGLALLKLSFRKIPFTVRKPF